ncbi:hypothetical protein DF186_17490, partial [Enterococcus hirae]
GTEVVLHIDHDEGVALLQHLGGIGHDRPPAAVTFLPTGTPLPRACSHSVDRGARVRMRAAQGVRSAMYLTYMSDEGRGGARIRAASFG